MRRARAAAIAELAARRLAGEPVARIVGAKEFWGLAFIVTPAVLVPRPETETVVELALALIDRQGNARGALRIADLGTGSGAILLALLSELPDASGIGTDIDLQALAVARRNAEALGLAARARVPRGDYGSALARSVRSRRVEPALRRDARDRSARAARCATMIRRMRSTAARMDLRPIGRSPRMRGACWGRAAGWWSRSGPARSAMSSALFIQEGLAIDAVRHDLSGTARARLRPLARPHR